MRHQSDRQILQLSPCERVVPTSLAGCASHRRSGKVWIADAGPGRPAVLGFRGKFHDASICPSVMVRLVAVLVQVLLTSEHAVENGFCFVMDAEGIGWNNFSLDAERIYMTLFTSLPVRLSRESLPVHRAWIHALADALSMHNLSPRLLRPDGAQASSPSTLVCSCAP